MSNCFNGSCSRLVYPFNDRHNIVALRQKQLCWLPNKAVSSSRLKKSYFFISQPFFVSVPRVETFIPIKVETFIPAKSDTSIPAKSETSMPVSVETFIPDCTFSPQAIELPSPLAKVETFIPPFPSVFNAIAKTNPVVGIQPLKMFLFIFLSSPILIIQ